MLRPVSPRLNHRQIEAFRVAMTVGSATAAADTLHITQPAVSRLISDLERRVGFALFERRKRGLQPTKDALLLYEEVTRSFRGLDRVAEAADAIRSRRIGHLRIIGMNTYSDGIVADAIGHFLSKHPGIRVELESGSKDDVVEGVTTENYDVGIAPLPVSDPAINTALILSHEAVCIAPPLHRFRSKRGIRAGELADEPFLAPRLGSPFRAYIDRYLNEAKVAPQICAETRSQRALCRLVARGAGIAIVDPTIAAEMPQGMLCILTLRPALVWSIAALTSQRRIPSNALNALLDELNSGVRRAA